MGARGGSQGVKLETFFEKFDQFADAPDAVAKMRELVLELAATGRLVPEVLERPVTEDTKLMGTLVELVMGQAPAGTECNTEGRGTVFVKVGEFGPLYPREEVWTTNPLKFAKKGDVLVCVVGATVGKLNLAIDCAIGRSAAAIRPSSALDTKFLYYSLVPYTLRLRRNSRGSAQGVIGKVELNAVSLWVPSREVQKRIVAKVDELMALCDRLEAQQQERETRHAALARASLARFADAPTPANLPFLFHPSYAIPPADLRKSILTLAVQGKLVPQDPNDEPAEKCLSRLGLRSTFVPPEGDDSENDSLPPAWAGVRFEDIAFVAGGVTLGRKLGDRKTVNLPYLRVANVKRGEIDLSVIKEVSIAEYEIERYALRENDLLMTEGGDWDKVGRAAIWKAEIPVCLHQNHVFRARMRSAELAPFWFERYFNSPVGRGYFESASKQTTNLASINMRQVRSCPIPLPPLAEQRRIVAKVEQLMSLVDALEMQLATSCATGEKLLAAVVAELTEGTHSSPAC